VVPPAQKAVRGRFDLRNDPGAAVSAVGLTVSGLRTYRTGVSRHAGLMSQIPRNPAERRVVRGEPRFLTREEVEGLADAAGDEGDVIRLL
jgi:hypothetical protein